MPGPLPWVGPLRESTTLAAAASEIEHQVNPVSVLPVLNRRQASRLPRDPDIEETR